MLREENCEKYFKGKNDWNMCNDIQSLLKGKIDQVEKAKIENQINCHHQYIVKLQEIMNQNMLMQEEGLKDLKEMDVRIDKKHERY
jgi:hypothetical protein